MGRSRDKAAEVKAYEDAVERAAKGEQVNLKAIRVETRREQLEFQRRVAEKGRGASNRQMVAEGKLTLAYAGQPTRTGSDILRGASSSRNIDQQPASVQKYVKTAWLNSDFNQGRIGADEYKRRLQDLNQTLAEKQQQEQMMRDRTSTKQAQSAAIKQREQGEIATRQGIAVGTVTDGKANVSANSQVFKDQKVSGFVDAQKNLMSQTSQQMQRDGKYKVETPDGETRVFKDRSTAEKFIERTKGKYAQYQQVQGPIQNNPSTPSKSDEKVIGFTGINQVLIQRETEPVKTPPSLIQYVDEKYKEQPQEYPKSYDPKTDNPLNFFRGFYEGGIKPLVEIVLMPKPIFSDILGRTPQEEATLKKSVRWVKDTVQSGPQTSGAVIEQALTGKPITGTGEGIYYDTGSLSFDVALAASPVKKVPVPVKISRYNQPGVSIFVRETAKKIKAPHTPAIVTRETTPTSIEVGFGTRTKPIISKVGDRINIGKPDLSRIETVRTSPATGKQTQRGIKFAADSTKYEQVTAKSIIPKIQGLDESSKVKAQTIEEIVKITTSPKKDTKTASTLPKKAFSSITETEQPKFVGTLTKEQKRLLNPIGTFEGSLSQQYFTLPKFMRTSGDVDLHASSYSKAAKQIKRIDPQLEADPGRKFVSVTSEKTKSAKEYLIDDKGRKEKVIEILNPEEVDEKGIAQVIEGNTLFGKKIPETKYKVTEGKTYGRQRQILKKGESLYSLQTDSAGKVTIGPAPFRREKDTADFYALARSAQETEFAKGSPEYKRLDELLSRFKRMEKEKGFDIDDYFRKNKVDTDPVTLKVEPSTLQRLGSSSSVASLPTKSSISLSKSLGSVKSSGRSATSSAVRSITSRPSTRSITSRPQSITAKKPSLSLTSKTQQSKTSPSLSKSTASMLSLGKSTASKSMGTRSTTAKSITSSSRTNKQTYLTLKKKIAPAVLIPWEHRTQKQKPSPRKPRVDFLGNTRVAEITGFRTKKTSIQYGKKTQKLFDDDLRKTKRKSKRSLSLGTKSLLGKSKKIIL